MAFKKLPAMCLASFFLLLLVSGAMAARPTRQLTTDVDNDDGGAAAAPVAAPEAAPAADDAPIVANAIPVAAGAAGAGAAGPVAAGAIPEAAGANPACGEHHMVFFMHDITMVTGQLPFARPNGGGNVNSGAVDNNNIPFLTGLGGATNAVKSGNGIPVFAGGSLLQGTTLQKLPFGTMTVVDDELTEAPALGSAAVGRAQGFYVASSEEGVSQTVMVTAMFKEEGFADTISFFGVHRTADSESHLAIVGGTGKYVGAKGFAKVAVVRPAGVVSTGAALETDGVETVLQFIVFLI
jgi:hypothetical protein